MDDMVEAVETASSNSLRRLKENRLWLLVLGALFFLAGIAMIGRPLVAGLAVAVLAGWMLVILGVSYLVGAFTVGGFGKTLTRILMAVFYFLAGLYIVSRPGMGLAVLTLVIAVAFIAEGVLKLVVARDLKGLPGRRWVIMSGIVPILLGLLIWAKWPFSTAYAVGLLVGLQFLFTGGSLFGLAAAVRRA